MTKFIVPFVLTSLLAAGCSRGPLTVSTIQLGKELNSDNSIRTHSTRFAPDDTIHVSVLNQEPGSGNVAVRWMLGGRVVREENKDVSYTDVAATEFHLDYAGDLPEGEYKVEILVDGQPAGERAFKVAR